MKKTIQIQRIQKIECPENRSAFLWGPRKTGKTTLLKQQFPDACWVDLLDYDIFFALSQKPTNLRQIIQAHESNIVVIDEVQKIPHLMDEIHWLIENKGYRFVMSGSSARKLRRGNVNLLGGRAWRFELFPLVSRELEEFDLNKALVSGFLPSHYLSSDSSMDLKAYINDYLKEEIQAEALTRNLPAFSRFLKSAAITNGMLLNYSNAAREAGVAVKTIREYYQILEDTLIGRQLAPWKKSKKRRMIETAKFFSLMLGLSPLYLVIKPLHLEPMNMEEPLNILFFRSVGRIDITVGWTFLCHSGEQPAALKWILFWVKRRLLLKLSPRKMLEAAAQRACTFFWKKIKVRKIIVSRDPVPKKLDSGIHIMPWKHFCGQLWDGGII